MAINSKTAEAILSGGNVMSFTNMASRAGAFPIDKWSIFAALSAAEAYVRQDSDIPGYGDATGLPYEGQIVAVREDGIQTVYVVDNSQANGLRKLATGGDTTELERKINQEISDRISADSVISAAVDAVSGVVDTVSSDLYKLSDDVELSVGNLEKNLSVTVEKLAVPADPDAAATYVVKQGGLSVGACINIPKDKVIENAYMVNVVGEPSGATKETISAFVVRYDTTTQTVLSDDTIKEGGKAAEGTFSSIKNAYFGKEGGDGPYLRITVSHQDTPVYIAMPKLVDTYFGISSDTVDVRINSATHEISADVVAGSIGTTQLTDGGVTTAKIALSAVDNTLLAKDAVRTDHIQDKAVTSGKIGDKEVKTANIDDKAVDTAQIALSAVGEAQLKNSAVSERVIQDGAVTTGKIADLNVTTGKLAAESVTTAKIALSAVTEAVMANDAVSERTIMNGNVTEAKLATGAVTATKIATDAVTETKILSGAVTTNKIADLNVTTAKIADRNVTTDKLADSAVTLGKLSSDVTDQITAWDDAVLTAANAHSDASVKALSAEVSTVYETKSDASDKLAEAKAYAADLCSQISVTVDGKIKDLGDAYKLADQNLSVALTGMIGTVSADTLQQAKDYTDTEIGKLDAEIAADGIKVVTGVKQVDGKVTALSTRTLGTADLSDWTTVKAGIKADYTAKDQALSAALTGVVNAVSADTLQKSKDYTDGKLSVLDLDVTVGADKTVKYVKQTDGQVSAEAVSIQIAESQVTGLEGDIGYLSSNLSSLSSNHETRITNVELSVSRLSSAMHFKGVNLSTELSTGSTVAPNPPYAEGETPADGDVVIVKDSKEFVWAQGQWHELGKEGVWATKTALDAETEARVAADGYISGKVDAEVERAKAAEGYLSGQISSLSDGFETWKTGTYAPDKATLEAADSYISGKVDTKVKVGYGTYSSTTVSNVESLSVVKIADEDYYKLVAEGKQNNDVVYIVSSDYVNGHDQRVINVGTAVSATDAVNLSGMNATIDAAKREIVAGSLSGVTINGVSAEVINNVATLSIGCIDCGGADT